MKRGRNFYNFIGPSEQWSVTRLVARLDMSIEVAPPNHNFAANCTFVRRTRKMHPMVSVESDVLVQIARVAERPSAKSTLKRLVPSVSSKVNFESVLSSVQFAAENANVGFRLLRGQ